MVCQHPMRDVDKLRQTSTDRDGHWSSDWSVVIWAEGTSYCSICDLTDVINCQLCKFAAALLGPVRFLSCRRTNSLEFTAWSLARSSCWLRTIQAGLEDISVRQTFKTLAH